jgi:glucan-binding YG repeat protein
MKSLTVDALSKMCKLSVSKVRKTIYAFKELGYIKEGVVQHNAKTYYVSEMGVAKAIKLID